MRRQPLTIRRRQSFESVAPDPDSALGPSSRVARHHCSCRNDFARETSPADLIDADHRQAGIPGLPLVIQIRTSSHYSFLDFAAATLAVPSFAAALAAAAAATVPSTLRSILAARPLSSRM